MTLLLLLSGYGPPVIGVVIEIDGVKIAITDLGNYVKSADVGFRVSQIPGSTVIGPVGILRWGLAQFGTTGILGYAPAAVANVQNLNVRRI